MPEIQNGLYNSQLDFIKLLSSSIQVNKTNLLERRRSLLETRKEVSKKEIQSQNDPVLVNLGGDIYVQYPPSRALEAIDGMLQTIDNQTQALSTKLDSASRAIFDLERIISQQSINDNLDDSNQSGEAVDEPEEADMFVSEDGLPMMEIVEELDDDGNITNSHVRPQRSEELVEFANGKLAELLEGRTDMLEGSTPKEKQKLQPKYINGKRVFGPEKPEWMLNGDPDSFLEKRRIKAGASNQIGASTENLESKNKNKDCENSKATQNSHLFLSNEPSIQVKEQLMQDKNQQASPQFDENSKPATEIQSPPRSLSPEADFSDNESDSTANSQIPEDAPFDPNTPAIPVSELLELELISNELDDEEDEDDEDSNGDNDEDEDDDNEDEFGRTRGSMFPISLAGRIQEELAKARGIRTGTKPKPPTKEIHSAVVASEIKESAILEESNEEAIDSDDDSEPVKHVRFSDTISIKRFEKVPPKKKRANSTGMISSVTRFAPINDLDSSAIENNEEKTVKMSRFKQERLEKSSSSGSAKPSTPLQSAMKHSALKNVGTQKSEPKLTEKVTIKPEVKNKSFDSPVVSNTIIERENDEPINPPVLNKKDKPMSRFRVEHIGSKNKATSSRSDDVFESNSQSRASSTESNNENKAKPKVSRFKSQIKGNKSIPRFPVSSRIEELESYSPDSKSVNGEPNTSSSKPHEKLIKDQIVEKDTCEFDELETSSKSDYEKSAKKDDHLAAAGSDLTHDFSSMNVNPALIKGIRSVIPPNVLNKANEYYEQSLMTEEDFIKAHLGNEDDSTKDKDKKEDFPKNDKDKYYKARPVLSDVLVEREDAPEIDAKGLGFLPDEYLKSKNSNDDNLGQSEDDDGDMDYTVNRKQLLEEYQKVRQSLIYKTGGFGRSPEEMLMEPAYEYNGDYNSSSGNGNILEKTPTGAIPKPAKKVSRFKAARLSNRRL